MSTFSKNYTTILAKAKQVVPGFSAAYAQFLEQVTKKQNPTGKKSVVCV